MTKNNLPKLLVFINPSPFVKLLDTIKPLDIERISTKPEIIRSDLGFLANTSTVSVYSLTSNAFSNIFNKTRSSSVNLNGIN